GFFREYILLIRPDLIEIPTGTYLNKLCFVQNMEQAAGPGIKEPRPFLIGVFACYPFGIGRCQRCFVPIPARLLYPEEFLLLRREKIKNTPLSRRFVPDIMVLFVFGEVVCWQETGRTINYVAIKDRSHISLL